jgi:nucleoside-diphosphate-sugar epimerase
LHSRDNFELTCRLASACVTEGIPRFIYVSSIGVLGTRSAAREPLRHDDTPRPESAYARAKLKAEQALLELSQRGPLHVAIVRPTLVYGAGAPGNLARLARAIEAGVPLPLAGIRNRRSLLNVRDLAALLARLVEMEELPAIPLLAADTDPVSTSELVRALAAALGRPARLFPIPHRMLRTALRAAGRESTADQLLANLEIDIEATCRATGWRPSQGLVRGLRALAEARSAFKDGQPPEGGASRPD